MNTFELLDVVVLTQAIPSLKLRKGELGAIIETFGENDFLVEFVDPKGVTYAMPILSGKQIMKVYYEPVEA